MRMYQVHMPALLIWIKSYVRYRIRPRREEWRLAMFARPPLPPERKLAQLGHAGRGTEFPHRAPLPQSGRPLPEFPTAGLENGGRQVGVGSGYRTARVQLQIHTSYLTLEGRSRRTGSGLFC